MKDKYTAEVIEFDDGWLYLDIIKYAGRFNEHVIDTVSFPASTHNVHMVYAEAERMIAKLERPAPRKMVSWDILSYPSDAQLNVTMGIAAIKAAQSRRGMRS